MKEYQGDAVIVGAGLAGMVAACQLLDQNQHVVMLDRADRQRFGGLAKQSFGGITIVDSPLQRKRGIKDSPDLGLKDWQTTANFEADDKYPRQWAQAYVERSREDIFEWLQQKDVTFFPVVHWVERGLYAPGNSVPRFHMVWGTGSELVARLEAYLLNHKNRDRLTLLFEHEVEDLSQTGQAITGCHGASQGQPFAVRADRTIVASGGICGSIEKVKRHWHPDFGTPPDVILNGSHIYADGKLHDVVEGKGGQLTHLENQWHYAAGVHHPKPHHKDHGLSLVPPKSALWLNAEGRRIGPVPLVTSFDTRFLVEQVCQQEKKYSWQVMNYHIAKKELAVSGSEYNDAIRDKRFFKFINNTLRGNRGLVDSLIADCPDFVVANDIPSLAAKMNELCGDTSINADVLRDEITAYDTMIDRGPKFHTDDQLRRIGQLRQYLGDRVRTCKYSKIFDRRHLPLIAVREFIVSRKSLGGIKTDLESRVLDEFDQPINGLWAVGEAAGFGGGGIHGTRTLEGTFLGGCILTGISATRH